MKSDEIKSKSIKLVSARLNRYNQRHKNNCISKTSKSTVIIRDKNMNISKDIDTFNSDYLLPDLKSMNKKQYLNKKNNEKDSLFHENVINTNNIFMENIDNLENKENLFNTMSTLKSKCQSKHSSKSLDTEKYNYFICKEDIEDIDYFNSSYSEFEKRYKLFLSKSNSIRETKNNEEIENTMIKIHETFCNDDNIINEKNDFKFPTYIKSDLVDIYLNNNKNKFDSKQINKQSDKLIRKNVNTFSKMNSNDSSESNTKINFKSNHNESLLTEETQPINFEIKILNQTYCT